MDYDTHDLTRRARKAAAQRLESLGRAGVTHLGKVAAPAAPGPQAAAGSTRPTASTAARPPAPKRSAPRPDPEGRCERLAAVARKVAACTRCRELVRNRTQTVFGVGNPYARLVFLGEGPGADEDRQGEPFVGRAGQLLNKILEACTLRREDVYILNIVKCRPPENRAPEPAEAAACREYLDAQLEIIRPEFICCLGAVAAQCLMDTKTSVGRLRGRVIDWEGCKVVCTWHPAYLLRNPAAKKETWEDMQLLMAAMGIELPTSQGPNQGR
jgi:uracil-DNA glycosylase